MMIAIKLIVLFIFLFIGKKQYTKGIDEGHHAQLEKIERWLRYSLHPKRLYWNFPRRRQEDKFEYLVPTEEEEEDRADEAFSFFNVFVSGKCLEPAKFETILDEEENFKWKWNIPAQSTKVGCPPWKRVRENLLCWCHAEVYSPVWSTVAEEYYEQDLKGFFGYEAHKVPKWTKTLLNISDLIGWHHFWAFNEFIKLPYIIEVEERLPHYENIMLTKLEPFYTKAGIKLGLINQIMEDNVRYKLNWHVMKAIKWGAWMVGPMLHMVLYRSLRMVIGDIVPLKQLGGMTLASMSRRDFAIYELVQKHNDQKMLECYEGMPRRDYVVYWLKQMYDALRQNYEENRVQFLEYTQLKPEQDPETQAMLSELSKYVPYWDKILETIDTSGIQGLDPTIDLFGPSEANHTVQEQKNNK